jgi:hypothetical protein
LDLREKLEAHRIIGQATEWLMREYNLTEEALNCIRAKRRNAHKAQRASAEAVLLAQQVSTRRVRLDARPACARPDGDPLRYRGR